MAEEKMRQPLHFGLYDFGAFAGFTAYAVCSLCIPMAIVHIGGDLNFPLDAGGKGAAGGLHLARSMAMIVTLFLCGSIAARLGKRISFVASLWCMGVGILLCAFSGSYWMLWPLLIVAGLGEGVCEGVATPLVQDLHPVTPERYVNIAHSFWSVGIFVCVFFTGGLLTLGVNWRIVLFFCGLAGILSSVPLMMKSSQAPVAVNQTQCRGGTPNHGWEKTVAIVKTPRFWVYALGMFMGAGSEFCLTFWTTAYLELNFGLTTFVASLGTGVIAIGMFLGRTISGYRARRDNLSKILLTAGLGTIPVTLMLSALSQGYITSRPLIFTLLFILLFLGGMGIAPFWPTLQVHGVNCLPQLDSTYLYIYFSACGIPGCGFFTWMIGVLGDRWGLPGAFLLIPSSLVGFSLIIWLEHWIFPPKQLEMQD